EEKEAEKDGVPVTAARLVVRCCSPGGFGTTEGDVVAWERRVDAADWDQAETTRQSDRKRLQAYAQRALDVHGRGVERLMAQLKLQLRRDIYGQILIGAVERGDRRAVEAALDRGANPEQQDALGNLAEELAAFAGHTELEELLFERRVGGRQHARLSAFFIHGPRPSPPTWPRWRRGCRRSWPRPWSVRRRGQPSPPRPRRRRRRLLAPGRRLPAAAAAACCPS
ncbi:unnamed protein product, partial [Prorocentrum cordatum]